LSVICNAKRVSHPIEHFAVIHLHEIAAARNAERFHRVGRHHAHLGVGRGRRGAYRVGVELHELAEAAGAGLFVAIDVAGAIAAIGLWQRLEIFCHVTRQRRGQIVAQRYPLLVVVLEREHALVRPVLVRQEFAERVGELHRRRFHRLKTVALVDLADSLDHLARGSNRGRTTIFQPARQAGAEFLGFFGFVSHFGSQPWAALVPAKARPGNRCIYRVGRHSAAMRSIEPGISRFPGVQLHPWGLVLRTIPE